MAKTYTALGTVAAGDVYTASAYNTMATDVNNFIVPPAAQVIRSTNLTSYTSGTAITWSSAAYDTDSIFSAGSPNILTIQTTGLYLIEAVVLLTATATLTSVQGDILLNGTSASSNSIVRMLANNTTTSGYLNLSTVSSLSATNTIGFAVSVSGGSAYIISGNSSESNLQSRLSVTWIGKTA